MYLALARRCGVVVRRAEDVAADGVDPESVRDLLGHPRVRLLAVTWVQTNSGLIQPVETLGETAAAAGVPYLIDACQAVGQLPIDVRRLRCDFLSATARKFLRGPRGIGFLYVSDGVIERGHYPLYIDMRRADWIAADEFELAPDARRLENWSSPTACYSGSARLRGTPLRSTSCGAVRELAHSPRESARNLGLGQAFACSTVAMSWLPSRRWKCPGGRR